MRHSLVKENNLHFIDQRVADDVTFFYQALQLSQTISQTQKITTYVNRDDDNISLSKISMKLFARLVALLELYADKLSKYREFTKIYHAPFGMVAGRFYLALGYKVWFEFGLFAPF